ncbi:MAG: hypothetical protein K2I52_03880 [Muribaculaceae bacterium]|nr:hypothetical protein [Muribaculaceae bacterium]
MKKFLFSLIALLCCISVSAQREEGYRGFVDLGYAVSVSEISDGRITYDVSNRAMISTTHGYQIIKNLFVGAGVGMTYWHQADNGSIGLPIFADVRADFGERKLSYFVDLKGGYSVADIQGAYFNPQVGIRLGLTEKFGLNLGIGYQMQKVKDISGSCDAITIKLGFDF